MRREKLDRKEGKVIVFCASIVSLPFLIVETGYKIEGKYLKVNLALPPFKVSNHCESLTKDGPINTLCENI